MQEEFLYEVLGFRGVTQNSFPDAVDQARIAAKEQAQRFPVVQTNSGDQNLIGGLRGSVDIFL